MAKKKSTTKQGAASATKATVKKAAVKKAPARKSVSAETAVKAGTPKAAVKKAAAPKKAAPKKAPAIKVTDKQRELLQKVLAAGESGFTTDQKAEERSLEALKEKKLLKKGAKDKATGKAAYMVTNLGKKTLGGTTA